MPKYLVRYDQPCEVAIEAADIPSAIYEANEIRHFLIGQSEEDRIDVSDRNGEVFLTADGPETLPVLMSVFDYDTREFLETTSLVPEPRERETLTVTGLVADVFDADDEGDDDPDDNGVVSDVIVQDRDGEMVKEVVTFSDGAEIDIVGSPEPDAL